MRSAADLPFAHLRAGGVSVLVTVGASGVPVIRHWGADLGSALAPGSITALESALTAPRTHSSVDVSRVAGILTQSAAGATGRPSVAGWRPGAARGGAAAPYFRSWKLTSDGATGAHLTARDEEAGLAIELRLALRNGGLLAVDMRLTNLGDDDYELTACTPALPVPARARELLDLTGRWSGERQPQRHPFPRGAWVRESRHGRPGHDATLVLAAGTPGFGFGTGEVWGLHVAWSGDHTAYAEATPEGDRVLGGGELLAPGEVLLASGEAYDAPTVLASWSDRGLDGLSARFHDELRSLAHLHGRERPVVLNTWEAVYFQHDLDTLSRLADVAAEVGVERFVLDDGWFSGRTDDTRGLGDWTVDRTRWPDGLEPLIRHVRGRGMQFGLWVEPEMVNEDSDLARAHPEWLLRGREELPVRWRHQQVLDLQHDGAYAHVRDALLALLREHDIAFLKWDHNRDLLDVTHAGRPAVHGQTLALYRLLDELAAAHPDVEIESCSSGGARIDLGILRRTHRVWASDTNDALERQRIQRWTQLLLPPELVGAHVGPPESHTTGRVHRLGFRAATALIGHFGLEWDLLSVSREERALLAEWIALHKAVRPLVRTGRLVRADHPDETMVVNGVVAPDRGDACFVLAQVAASPTTHPVAVRLPGLDPARSYRVTRVDPRGPEPLVQLAEPPWLADGVELPGVLLDGPGLQLPVMAPETALVLRVTAVTG